MNETLTLPPGVELATEGDRRQELYAAITRYLGDEWTGTVEFHVRRGRIAGHYEHRSVTQRITEEGPNA